MTKKRPAKQSSGHVSNNLRNVRSSNSGVGSSNSGIGSSNSGIGSSHSSGVGSSHSSGVGSSHSSGVGSSHSPVRGKMNNSGAGKGTPVTRSRIMSASRIPSAPVLPPAVSSEGHDSALSITDSNSINHTSLHSAVNKKKQQQRKMSNTNKVCLIVIDGWGLSDKKHGNAILAADTPVMDKLCAGQNVPLDASGLAVGLPDGLMGNSEVGHLNIGAGRPIYQDIVRINMDVDKHTIHTNPNFVDACHTAKTKSGGRLHLLGLVSDGGVHAHINHMFALLAGAKAHGVPKTFIHFFADGRDTLPHSGISFVKQTLANIKEHGYGSLSTIMGRYYAMDRDKRWERIKIAYDGLVQGVGENATVENVAEVINGRYNATNGKAQTDEFLTPIILNKEGLIHDNDTLLFFDYRADRMRQIAETFGGTLNFETDKQPKHLSIYTMTQYKKEFPFKNLYPPSIPKNVLAEVISSHNKLQLHVAETEKYAHVTFFFNGGQEQSFPGEDRILVPSPKVATYDLMPTMSAAGVADEMSKAIATKKYDFVMCNFANPDMVGHTGKYEAAVVACATTDRAIGQIQKSCEENGYTLLVTADHGNAEQMYDDKGGPFTAHTNNLVPFALSGGEHKFIKPTHHAALADVAPTVLALMSLPKPTEMTGHSLLAH